MVRVVSAVLVTDRPVMETASMLRGYIGRRFAEYKILHNHQEKGYTYKYPLVQYKLLQCTPIVLGIEKGADILMKILPEIETLQLAQNNYKVTEAKITHKKYRVHPTDIQKNYRFITPWLGLNRENRQRYYQTKSWKERKKLLNSILTGNILSMCKGLNITVDD